MSETSSMSGSQVKPPFLLRHSPPDAADTYRMLLSLGSTATPVTLPVVESPETGVMVLLGLLVGTLVGPGPCGNQRSGRLGTASGPLPRILRLSPPMVMLDCSS